MPSRHRRLFVEPLEDRRLLADLILQAVSVVQQDSPLVSTTPVVGERICVRADYRSVSLPTGASYRLEFVVDGVSLSGDFTSNGAGSSSGNWYWYRCGWYASPGPHTVERVTVDPDNNVAETSESNNTLLPNIQIVPGPPTTLPQKFIRPLSGSYGQDWSIVNYNDVDPTSGLDDSRGGLFTYDGHDAYDMSLSNFAQMDVGLPVYAAADGTVESVQDGNFDRNTTNGSRPANFLVINHGSGWKTQYYHFRVNTITVQAGNTVKVGQLLGLAGSSGNSDGAHLHFSVRHFGAPVEPEYSPADYFLDPIGYQGDQPTTIKDIAVTNFNPSNVELEERPATQPVFSTATPQIPRLLFWVANLPLGQSLQLKQYRPDGSLAASVNFTWSSYIRNGWFWWNLGGGPISNNPGTWRFAIEKSGVELASHTFEVVSGPGTAGIKVTAADGSPIIDNRTTAYDLGNVVLGGSPAVSAFSIANHGAAPLVLANPIAPPGFSLASSFPATIPAGGTSLLSVRLDTDVAGSKFGAVQFTTNDPVAPLFTFNVKGAVTGAAPTDAPVLNISGPATAYTSLGQAIAIRSTATVSDPNSSSFAGGSLAAEFTAVSSTLDGLGIATAGIAAGQIGVSDTTVTYGGTAIGTMTSSGAGGAPLKVALNASATIAAVQALLRAITFSTTAVSPASLARYVRFTLTDDTGNVSNQPIAVVVQDLPPATINAPPTLTAAADQVTVLEDAALQTVSLINIAAGLRESQKLTITASSSDLSVIPGPAISYLSPNNTGSLTFKPLANQSGVVSVMVKVQDDGGTANGGNDTFLRTFTVNILPVNDAPTFIQGANVSATDAAGPYSVVGWATDIYAGALDESSQQLAFSVDVDDKSLFSAAPQIDAAGQLNFTPAPNTHGTATVTVRLQDDGGTASGGKDASAAQTFKITIDKPKPLHNTLHGLDVTNSAGNGIDGVVAAGDALAIINFINVNGARDVRPADGFGPAYLDTVDGQGKPVGDNSIAPGDALAVINWINVHGGNSSGPDGESERAAWFPPATAAGPGLEQLLALLSADLATQPRRRRGGS